MRLRNYCLRRCVEYVEGQGVRTERTHIYFQLRGGQDAEYKVQAGHWNWSLHIVISVPMGREGTDALKVLRMIRNFASRYGLKGVTLVEAGTQVRLFNDLHFSRVGSYLQDFKTTSWDFLYKGDPEGHTIYPFNGPAAGSCKCSSHNELDCLAEFIDSIHMHSRSVLVPVCFWQSISIVTDPVLGFLMECLCSVEGMECKRSTLDNITRSRLGALDCVYDQDLETGPVDKWDERLEVAYFGDDEEGDQYVL